MNENVQREAENRLRELRPGDLVPTVQYQWEPHGWLLGVKNSEGEWLRHVFISGPLRSEQEFGIYLSEFAGILQEGQK